MSYARLNKKILGLVILSAFFLTAAPSCKLTSGAVKDKMKPIKLIYWRVFDEEDSFKEIFDSYKALHPYISIEYRKLRFSEYENELLNAYAEDRAPDIISLHNTWIEKYKNKISPMPEYVSIVYPEVRGSLKKEVFQTLKKHASMTPKALRDAYIDSVYYDAVLKTMDEETKVVKEQIYGLPLSVDTLALFYNRDLLDNASVSRPPAYWNAEFQQSVKRIAKQDANGQIIQAGIALGGSANIERYSDILSVLMMQNGTVMMEGGNVIFNVAPESFKSQGYNPGQEALRFYTDFANPTKEVYTWNNKLDNSLEMFIQGRVGMILGYSYHLPVIKGKAQKLNFGVAKLPQIEGSSRIVNFANYWLETVSSKSKYKDEAWDLVQYMAAEKQARVYLKNSKKPTALRSLVDEQSNDPELGVFADQLLTAKSWYHGKDPLAAEYIIGQMIDSVASGTTEMEIIMNTGASKVEQTVR